MRNLLLRDERNRKSERAAAEENEEISAEEEASVARSKEWFNHNEGIPFEQIVADLGLTLNEIRSKDPL